MSQLIIVHKIRKKEHGWSESKFKIYTYMLFNDKLPKFCQICGVKKNLLIHHKKYIRDLKIDDVMRLYLSCHVQVHKEINSTKQSV